MSNPETAETTAVTQKPKLNPSASAFRPSEYSEYRCLFFTFSNGFPLTEAQIHRFFNRRYGPCVENVYVHRFRTRPPLFGKVIFTNSCIPILVLNGEERVYFLIDGCPLYCRRFDPDRPSSSGHYQPSTSFKPLTDDD